MSIVDWCDSNHLVLKVTKAKELVNDFRKQTKAPDLTVIKEKDVERVDTLIYLGVVPGDKLMWRQKKTTKNKTSFILFHEATNFLC